MELQEAVQKRRSIRNFLDKPVPEEDVNKIISDAIWAPSWGNSQPWEIIAATGSPLDQFKKENQETIMKGELPNPDIKFPAEWPEKYQERLNGIERNLFDALSIDPEDFEGGLNYYGDMFSIFDAPVFLILTVDKKLSLEYAMIDMGSIMQNICLLAHDRGLGTCLLAASISYPEISRKLFSIPDTKNIVCGIALGWPDSEAPENNFERSREGVNEFLRWVR